MKKPLETPPLRTETTNVFTRAAKGTINYFKKQQKPMFPWIVKPTMAGVNVIKKASSRVGPKIAPMKPFIRKVGRGGLGLGLWVGAGAMVALGFMKGVNNASREIVAQRQMQDQRYARNITMMSRLGYTTGTSSMNRYNHTVGLSQALSANRHGRGGY